MGKKVAKSETHYKVRNLLYWRKAIGELKSAGEITIRWHIVERGENEMAIVAHCESWNILTKWSSISKIAICGFSRDKVNKVGKGKRYLWGPPDSVTKCGGLWVVTSS